jgi:FKBP-type peptidyl-prolyl cis-trans isomerase
VTSRRRSLFAGVAAATLAACGGQGKPEVAPEPAPAIESTTFGPSLEIDLAKFTKHRSGLYYLDENVGDGPVAAVGRTVRLRYVVALPNGTVVESQTAPVEFELGQGVIRGFNEGIPGMKPGGVRKIIVPPGLAYGRTAHNNIPPNSILVFDVQLIGVR